MKRVLALLLSLLLVAAMLTACGKKQPTNQKTEFDETNIVMQFGALSDIHIGRTGTNINTVLWAKDAYKTLRDIALQYNDKGLDAVLVSGDLTNNGTPEQVAEFADIYETVFDPAQVPLIFSLGNHDVNVGSSYNKADMDFEQFYAALGQEYRQYEKDSDLANAGVHQVVNGYHFVALNPIDETYRNSLANSANYTAETKEWLDKTLEKITRENPNQYVFVSTHPIMYGMAYGGEHTYTTTAWFTRELNEILKKYPQAVIFGGHVHFSINSDLSIMQDGFTSLQCGSVNYMSNEDGEYRDSNSAVSLSDREQVHSGYLVQVDANNNVRILRLNFGYKKEVKYPFVLQSPQADGSHLLDYGWDRGSSEKNEAPVLPADAISIVDDGAEKAAGEQVTPRLTFKAGTDDDQIHAYAVSVRDDRGYLMETQRVLADFYKVRRVDQMKETWSFTLTGKYYKGETYEIMLVAADDWGVASEPVTFLYQP